MGKPVDLSQLIYSSMEPFLSFLKDKNLSKAYLNQSRFIIKEFATFCDGSLENPWILRRNYLSQMANLRSKRSFSLSYLENHGRELKRFSAWYRVQLVVSSFTFGKLSDEQLQSYWANQPKSSSCRRSILKRHLTYFLSFLSREYTEYPELDEASVVNEYFEKKRMSSRAHGWGYVMRHRARIVTRRVLEWLEKEGHLPKGTAAYGISMIQNVAKPNYNDELLQHFTARLDSELPKGLREPLLDYLDYLINDRRLAKGTIKARLYANQALCRILASKGLDSFDKLNVKELDEASSMIIKAPIDDIINRRQQVRTKQNNLRGFLRYLYQRRLLDRDLAATLVSPPCYRVSKPVNLLSEEQVQKVLDSVNRKDAAGRRNYAMLQLITTYGLRPIDVARLCLDAFHWRDERFALVQSKTGHPVMLPLLPEVAKAIVLYLQNDRPIHLPCRELFLTLYWPHQPLNSRVVSTCIKQVLAEAGLSFATAKHLRSSLATHLLRSQAPLGVIQDMLGHKTPDTTQRYALADLEMLRLVLEDSER